MKRKPNIRPHHVYVIDGEGDNAYWTKIGGAWPHDDGQGFNLKLQALPLDGKLVIRAPKASDAEAGR